MSHIALPVLYTLLVWWFSTGLILYAIGRSWRTYPRSIALAFLLLIAALWSLWEGRNGREPWDAYVGFTGAIAVWGFVELTFLTGTITGTRLTPCPANTPVWRRARYATETIIYHEFALLAAGGALAVATITGSNRVAVSTFIILWVMRLSAKLNLFLGVRVFNEELLPYRLLHLSSYFRSSSMNPLFPISVLAATFATGWLVCAALAPDAGAFETASALLLASLIALGLIEHVFLMLPISITGLWRFALRGQAPLTARNAHPHQIHSKTRHVRIGDVHGL